MPVNLTIPMPNPDRGEVWLVDLGYAAKVRPCLVLSIPILDQDRALCTIVPHTTSPRASRFEVDLRVSFLKPGVFDAQNLVTIPQAKLIRRLGTLKSSELVRIGEAVLEWLGLNLN
jgi:mRNA interferase MazF